MINRFASRQARSTVVGQETTVDRESESIVYNARRLLNSSRIYVELLDNRADKTIIIVNNNAELD